MRKISIIPLLVSVLVMLAIPAYALGGTASAADIFSNCGAGSSNGQPDVCGEVHSTSARSNNDPIITILKTAITVISYITGGASIIGILVSSLKFVTAGGDSKAVSSARSGLIYSLVGIAITVLAQILVIYVINS
jgi:hypothetical protein